MNFTRLMTRLSLFLVMFTLMVMGGQLSAAAKTLKDPRLKDVADVVKMYLDGKVDAAEEAAMEKLERMTAGDANLNDPVIVIMDYLSGNRTLNEKALSDATKKSPGAWGVASLAIFVRKLGRAKTLDSFDLEGNVSMYQLNSQFVDSKEINQWKKKSELWLKWCTGEFEVVEGVEPLLSSRSRQPREDLGDDITKVDPKKFDESRKKNLSKRYRPLGLEFDKDKMRQYRDSLPFEQVKLEELARYRYIKDVKGYLVRIMERNPYDGSIRLRQGGTRGTIGMANEHVFLVRRSARSTKSKRYEWKDLHPKQFVEFLEFYAKQRINKGAPNITKEERMKQAAEDVLRAAVILDWYGYHEDSLKEACEALRISPELKDTANKLFLGKK